MVENSGEDRFLEGYRILDLTDEKRVYYGELGYSKEGIIQLYR
ncbi:hypothetical protein ACFLX5_00575 [Chloroflexota bacterium]